MEAALLTLGSAVVKSVLTLWIGDVPVAADLGRASVDQFLRVIPGLTIVERHRAARDFERMAESVSERLTPLLDNEFGGLPDNEREAAVLAVAGALDRAGIDSGLLLSQDLDPLRLEAHVRAGARVADLGLSGAATVVYDQLLREACNYAIEVAVTLPGFTSQALKVSLGRESELITLIDTVLNRLPDPAVDGRSQHDADHAFDTQYRRSLARTLDVMELIGLDVSPLSKRYALSVAYVSLSTAQRAATGHRTGTGHRGSELVSVRVHEALADANRLLVRGAAGSGKTTLLKWLAVTGARQRFTGRLTTLNDTVPFFIRLRRYAQDRLPEPERFLDDVTPSLAGAAPPGWIRRQLEAGRGIVLVDGVDELPDDGRRDDARRWLADLAGTFPRCRYLVTSRSTAADEGWLDEAGFRASTLEPMGLPDIDTFVVHWHDAVRAALPDPEGQKVRKLGERLRFTLRERPALRGLAATPLLAAMLCALHRERSEKLPEDRMELYRVALELLLERRDVERRIPGAELLPLREKIILLRDLAGWMALNSYVDADADAVRRRVKDKLESMPRVRGVTPAAAYRFLLERSGILRSPVEGRVDFVHRTFQEYLAAQEFIEQDSLGMLLGRATDAAWWEIVILAAGHASPRHRSLLLGGLLDAAAADGRARHQLYLLAAACLETSPEVPADLVSKLEAALATVVPPTTVAEARAVASAGQMAVPLLAGARDRRARAVAATVRALALIGGDQSLDAVAAHARDPRSTVVEELWRAWDAFDAEDYAARVLARTSPPSGEVVVTDDSRMAALHHLTAVTKVAAVGPATTDLSTLAALPRLTALRLEQCRVGGLHQVGALRGLTELRVSHLPVTDLRPIATLTGMRHLALRHTAVTDVSPLAGLRSLVRLDLHDSPVADIDALAWLAELADLDLSGTAVEDLRALGGLIGLHRLALGHTPVTDLSPLSALTCLEVLDLGNSAVTDISPLTGLGHLSELYLQGTAVADVSALSRLPSLRRLRLDGTPAAYRSISRREGGGSPSRR